ncbi:PAS domain S-box-containing protein [Salinibacillus kushneri]|uniref:PAS domain S-box-containing protein n=1 Tax=Salinibacillus kushneri TaxID=237682 RepID=A0A1I0AEK7_9BACI|nr:sigma-54-dependent Fis family transcriptional regulator [Salinibacillus kushneri]SES92247.1 PAS domain S-box-containing protein [Salinibacillus kushneri]
MHEFIQSHENLLDKDGYFQVKNWMATNPSTVQRDISLIEAAELLQKKNLEYIPVVNKEMNPVGILTVQVLLDCLIHNDRKQRLLGDSHLNKNFTTLYVNDSILGVCTLPDPYFLVVKNNNKLIGILTRDKMLKALSSYIFKFQQEENTAEILNVILESAYEGIAVVDNRGIIIAFNDAYCQFIGIDKKDAIGRNVEEVIDNTNLHNTIRTGMPERGAIQHIQGQPMIVHRIPIWKEDRVVGAIGMIIFEGITELYKIYERLQKEASRNKKEAQIPFRNDGENHIMTLDQIIGDSECTSKLKRMARKVAKTNVTVLITGESGTGKEMYAQGIHHLSPYAGGKFVSVNCGAIPEHLFETELFGYEEGAFTGAKKGGKPGKFELAQNGTLFLDEIAEMPLPMQTKLLRILQEREFERVGGTKKYKLNTRIIAATNQNLKKMVDTGEFREDLYYRINVIELPVLPLRERAEDIPALVSYYLNKTCSKYHIPTKTITSEAMAVFLHYGWQGNIRELVNVIEKLVVLVEGDTIKINHLPKYMVDRKGHSSHLKSEKPNVLDYIKESEKEKEKETILTVLNRNNGNKSKTAKELGIHRTTLYQKLKKHHLL